MAKEIQTLDDWNATLATSPGNRTACVLYAEWHPPSNQLLQLIKPLSKDYAPIQFYQIDIEKCKDVLKIANLEVSSVPTVLFYEAGFLCGKLVGFHPPKLMNALTKWKNNDGLPDGIAVPKKEAKQASTLDIPEGKFTEYLEKLVETEPVMLFIKGTKTNPFCRFSKTAVNLLNDLDIKYGTFDILSNENVRSGLKEFSSWPTFPQLYVKGEFIGGVDIMKELYESNSLLDIIPEECKAEELNQAEPVKLEELIKREPVMLFMKGTPSDPQCGFSKQMCLLLEMANINYGSFDILQDKKVREELKVYSEWPTYPQLYAGGDLIGGVDIVKELIEMSGVEGFIQELEERCGQSVLDISKF